MYDDKSYTDRALLVMDLANNDVKKAFKSNPNMSDADRLKLAKKVINESIDRYSKLSGSEVSKLWHQVVPINLN